jgi:hypothetical protein
MSVEIHDSLIALLSEVAALKEKEGGRGSARKMPSLRQRVK